MYVVVKLLNGFSKELTYKVPLNLINERLEGCILLVPLRKRIEVALVVGVQQTVQDLHFEIREFLAIVRLPEDHRFKLFLDKIAYLYFTSLVALYGRLQTLLLLPSSADNAHEKKDKSASIDLLPSLTEDQHKVVSSLLPAIKNSYYAPTLLHGVTGSGKTEVYKKLILEAIGRRKSVIFLLPEVSLSVRFLQIFAQQIPSVSLYGFHSGTKNKEKAALWASLQSGEPVVIIGVHLPIFLPIANLGLIIIDEEHENFQEMHYPKINSKEAAIVRAHLYGIPILLGSATPSLTSLHCVSHKQWAFFSLKQRFSGNFVTIQKVLLSQKTAKKREFFWISDDLSKALKECLERKEQAIIYLNRRGYSFFVQCSLCSFIFTCPHCSVSLTLHKAKRKDQEIERLCCHYCDYSQTFTPLCGGCQAPEKHLLKKGIGTQQVVQMIQKLFPHARVARADHEMTINKNKWQETVEQFQQGELDIFVGTRVITKGYHFPRVTLVGILWADLTLNFPDYSAVENTLQQLVQVAGRAGRAHLPGKVIVQAMQDYDVFNYLQETDYLNFVEDEMVVRKKLFYPPFCRLLLIECTHKKEQQVAYDAQYVADCIRSLLVTIPQKVIVLGPALPAVWKIQRIHKRHIYLKAESFELLHKIIKVIQQTSLESAINISLC